MNSDYTAPELANILNTLYFDDPRIVRVVHAAADMLREQHVEIKAMGQMLERLKIANEDDML